MKRRRVHAWRKVVRQVQQENGGQRRTISLSNHVSLEPNLGQVLLSVLSTYCHLEPNPSLLGTATSTSPQLPNPLFQPFHQHSLQSHLWLFNHPFSLRPARSRVSTFSATLLNRFGVHWLSFSSSSNWKSKSVDLVRMMIDDCNELV